jgi:hypothetical protein
MLMALVAPEILEPRRRQLSISASVRERLDPLNGLLLVAHIDALFDNGLISFENDGTMLVSDRVAREERRRFKLPASLRLKLTKAEKNFLGFHRRYRLTSRPGAVGRLQDKA